jgi:hypothetical protein
MVDQIDLISSVSGGSVTAGYFALKGMDMFKDFEANFLKHNVQGDLVGTALNPVTWFRLATPAYSRIDVLRDYFDEDVFDHATYGDILGRESKAPGRRPYIVLNAGDMATGSVFSFNQDQFDLICSDLSQLKLADAVAASAAFPVALTAITLRNHSPCPSQAAATNIATSGWRMVDCHPRPIRVENDLETGIADNPDRYRRGILALHYLNELPCTPSGMTVADAASDRETDYVQLLDGGIADNLGLNEPISLLTSLDRSPSILGRINRGTIKRVAFVVVNARSEASNDFGKRNTPPGLIDTIWTTAGSPIDAASFLMLNKLRELTSSDTLRTTTVMVDFDYISDAACRKAFKNVATSWKLADSEIDALIILGRAMVLDSPGYAQLISELGGQIPPHKSIDDACGTLAARK